MFLDLNTAPRDPDTCALSGKEREGWVQAVWRGYVAPIGAANAEAHLPQGALRLLLNDNLQLTSPWFESLDWLAEN